MDILAFLAGCILDFSGTSNTDFGKGDSPTPFLNFLNIVWFVAVHTSKMNKFSTTQQIASFSMLFGVFAYSEGLVLAFGAECVIELSFARHTCMNHPLIKLLRILRLRALRA
jgi:hypothetical protein